MKTLLLMVVATAALAGCVLPGDNGSSGPQASPAALAALPRGIDPGFLIQGEDGCYGVALEAAAIPTGVPLVNAAGQQVCDAPT